MAFLGIDWGKILSVPFWLDVRPGELSPLFEKYFLAVLFFSYFFYFLSCFLKKRFVSRRNFIKANFWRKFSTFCLTMAVSFTFIFFFRYEAIPFLGGRFWILIWLIAGIIWLGFLLKYYFINLPQELKKLEEKKKFSQYLSNARKK
ncbi:MAG TPA: hypothetical protein ENN28_02775 [Candidatus Uhrbacteria bacterium]|nr:hypothetical protein [Candidatus Uhrbacteria bacterium]